MHTVLLDFAKAVDKVIYRISLEEVPKQNVKLNQARMLDQGNFPDRNF